MTCVCVVDQLRYQGSAALLVLALPTSLGSFGQLLAPCLKPSCNLKMLLTCLVYLSYLLPLPVTVQLDTSANNKLQISLYTLISPYTSL